MSYDTARQRVLNLVIYNKLKPIFCDFLSAETLTVALDNLACL